VHGVPGHEVVEPAHKTLTDAVRDTSSLTLSRSILLRGQPKKVICTAISRMSSAEG
jgi:hypothetical protein